MRFFLPFIISLAYFFASAVPASQRERCDSLRSTHPTKRTLSGYGYSAHGELKTVSIPGEGILSVSQYKWTQPSEILLPGGTRQQKSYDGLLNLEGLNVKNANQQPLLELQNSYNKRLELLDRSRTDTIEGQGTAITNAYTYDDESRLTKAVTDETGTLFAKDTETFTLDGVGNRIGHSKDLGDWSYDANNRLTEKGLLFDKASYSYDDAGSLTQKTQGGNSTNYAYDSQNRLVEVSDKDNRPIARYGYDPFDRRIWKEAYRSKDGAALSQPTRSYYLYADEGLIAEATQAINPPLSPIDNGGEGTAVTATTAPTITTQYGPRPNSPFTTAVLFIKTKNSAGQNTIAYYHHDHLGTPIQATDRSGIVVWSAQYNAFGQASITTPTATDDKPTVASGLRFPGQVEDAETGLYYNWHRYYDPELGRYVTADPIGLVGGVNLYAYVNGNPVDWMDPTGLVKAPGTGESFIPIWGSARQAAHDIECGNYGWAAFNAGMALLDATGVGATIKGGRLALKAGSHTWGATRKWLGKYVWNLPKGTHVHHWFVPQRFYENISNARIRDMARAIFNQPWNLMPVLPRNGLTTQELHNAIEGKGRYAYGFIDRLIHGTPLEAKFIPPSIAGDAANLPRDEDNECECNN